MVVLDYVKKEFTQHRDLSRFLRAQENEYSRALDEIKSGKKVGHWMWYIFPQIIGLGYSQTNLYYSIKNLKEAKKYLEHEVLGQRLREITSELLKIDGSSIYNIFDDVDSFKLKSSMTLFSLVDESEDKIFNQVLDKFYR